MIKVLLLIFFTTSEYKDYIQRTNKDTRFFSWYKNDPYLFLKNLLILIKNTNEFNENFDFYLNHHVFDLDESLKTKIINNSLTLKDLFYIIFNSNEDQTINDIIAQYYLNNFGTVNNILPLSSDPNDSNNSSSIPPISKTILRNDESPYIDISSFDVQSFSNNIPLINNTQNTGNNLSNTIASASTSNNNPPLTSISQLSLLMGLNSTSYNQLSLNNQKSLNNNILNSINSVSSFNNNSLQPINNYCIYNNDMPQITTNLCNNTYSSINNLNISSGLLSNIQTQTTGINSSTTINYQTSFNDPINTNNTCLNSSQNTNNYQYINSFDNEQLFKQYKDLMDENNNLRNENNNLLNENNNLLNENNNLLNENNNLRNIILSKAYLNYISKNQK
ncbi:hypothetical protein PIROE2DRAFT_13431 [Piromyces sp. E2]|nr:hypothetical protein PIROE2DRAFT_13431 [Piromyces sp. E2]|eukprot:OUM60746.1 hypothetical protein PIROE2DRAFT_13431 [Piromyces sp. E2]